MGRGVETVKLKCPDCGARMVLRQTEKWPQKNGKPSKFWGCSQFPKCKTTHGAHPNGQPLGRPANIETKAARMKAHEAFGAWMERNSYTKKYAYRRLAKMLRLSEAEAHMGMMAKERCEVVVRLCEEKEIVR